MHVYELNAKISTVYCVSGTKEYTPAQVLDVLGLAIKNDPRGICHDIGRKFITPVGPSREKMIKRIRDIKPDATISIN